MSVFNEVDPSEYLWQSDLFFAISDKFPVSQGHALIISRSPAKDFFSLTEEEKASLFVAIDSVKALIEGQHSPDGFNVGMNCGAAAGQTVMHFHCHVIPRYEGDMERPEGGVRFCIPEKGPYNQRNGAVFGEHLLYEPSVMRYFELIAEGYVDGCDMADAESLNACRQLARICLMNSIQNELSVTQKYIPKKDLDSFRAKGLYWLRMAALEGSDEDICGYAKECCRLTKTPESVEHAMRALELAAEEKGNTDAQLFLGMSFYTYRSPCGFEDYSVERSLKWYELAALSGDLEAADELQSLCAINDGVYKCITPAFKEKWGRFFS